MQCQYCRTWNEEDERRCVRCGRRLHASAPRSATDAYPLATATAPAFEEMRGLESIPGGQPLASSPPEAVTYQPSLFRETPFRDPFGRDVYSGPKVIPIPTLTPARPAAGRDTPRKARPAAQRPSPRRGTVSQQSLDFQTAHGGAHSLGTQVQAVIYCDAPVALPTHRMIAAAFDASMIVMALGVFLGIFFLSGGMLELTRQNAPFLVSVAAVLVLFYRFLWVLGDGDTPGMRFAGLKLVNFDGRPPDREQRAVRQVATLLSFLSAGLGLIWALVDEENLAWHDHISKTFPTPG